MKKITVLLLLCLQINVASAENYQKGDIAYLCFKHSLQYNWPEFFAYQVEVVDILDRHLKVKVVNSYAMAGRVNEEQTPVAGDIMKISRQKVYTVSAAGVRPGTRFNGKPVCKNLMS